MKKIVLLLLIVVSVITFYSCQRAGASSTIKDKQTSMSPATINSTLKEAGFTNLSDFVKQASKLQKEYYKNKYGLEYLSDEEVSQMLIRNDFIMGAPVAYIDNIPLSAGEKLVTNLKKLENEKRLLTRFDAEIGEFITEKEASDRWEAHAQQYQIEVAPLVMVAAPRGKFDVTKSRVILNKNLEIDSEVKDPIAFYKTSGGYVVLAIW